MELIGASDLFLMSRALRRAAPPSSVEGSTAGDRLRHWHCAGPFVKTVFRLLERSDRIRACGRLRGATGTSQSLARGLAILSTFHSDRPLIGVSELSRGLDLSRSTVHRYVATLAKLGYLQQDPDSKRYRLGPKVLDLGFSALNSMDLLEVSAPHLRQLSDETHRTVNVAILEGVDVVYIERCRAARPGQQEIDLNLHVGARLPAYCTAMGKAILAFVPEDLLEETIARIEFVPRGPNTITRRGGVPRGARPDPHDRASR